MNLKPVHIGLEIEDVQKVIAISLRVGPSQASDFS